VAEEDEKLKFISRVVHKELPMTAACAAAGISRKTGYKWLARYRDGGVKSTDSGRGRAHRIGTGERWLEKWRS
jgi:transposase